MQTTWARWIIAAGMAVCVMTTNALAIGPWDNVFSGKRVEADPDEDYVLQKNNGPWLILAASFSGDRAIEQAHRLVVELRKRYKLEAFMHHMRFEETTEDVGMGLNKYGRPAKFKFNKNDDSFMQKDEFAVLVGDFTAVDDPRLQDALKQIKTIRPDALTPEPGQTTYQNLALWRSGWRMTGNENAALGPLGKAFAIPNPLIEQADLEGIVDEEVAKWNAQGDYNLLKNPAKYTLKVATFNGAYTWVKNGKELRDYETGEKSLNGKLDKEFDSQLEKASAMAAVLCEALRAKGYPAYEFHDRNCSIVTIGGWNSLGRAGEEGKIILHQEIVDLMEEFRAKRVMNPKPGYPTVVPVVWDVSPRFKPFTFDGSPELVRVPRRSIASAYKPRETSGIRMPW